LPLFQPMRLAILFVFSVVLTVFGQGTSKTQPKGQVLFTAGKATVNTEEFAYLYRKNHQHKPEDFTATKVEEYLDLYVNFKLKVLEAMNRGLDTTRAFKKEFDQYREEIKKPYVSEGDDLDRLVKEAYQRMTEQVRVSHILIMVKAEATPADTLAAWNKIMEARKRALAGEDFGQLAAEYSEEPSAKTTRGDLRYFSAMEMVYPFETAAYQTKVGEISPVVKTRFGYHVLKVVDRRATQGEVEVSHIMLLTGKGDDAKARNTIFEVNDQLKAGGKWDELCKQYSEDPNTKNTGGRLKQFGLGTFAISAPEFEKAVFAMKNPGDVTDPFQTSFGWHIVRLEKKIPPPTFKDVQASLSRRIARDERLQLSKATRTNKLKTQFQLIQNPEAKKLIENVADSSLQKGKWKHPKTSNLIGMELCKVSGRSIKGLVFFQYVEMNQSVTSGAPKTILNNLYDRWIESLLNNAEEEQLIRDKPEFKTMLEEYREGILLFTIMEQEVWNKASNDSLGQRKLYDTNLTKYKAGDRVLARVFTTDNKSVLNEFKTKVANGDTLTATDLRKLKSVSNFRAFEKGESKVVDKISWAIGMHETELDGLFYLVEVSNLIPPGIKSFDDARASVISDYQDKLEKEWVAGLKKKYPVSINSKGKKVVIQELTAKK
jgi:peptidyl-prolyl cis-trans isomerase SurA